MAMTPSERRAFRAQLRAKAEARAANRAQKKFDATARRAARKSMTPEERIANITRAAELGITDIEQLYAAVQREAATRHLYDFIKQGWRYIDPAPFIDGWHIKAVCEHIEASTKGEIRHLLINIPPRCMKSIAVSVALAPWLWIQRPRKEYVDALKNAPPPLWTPPTPPIIRDPLRGPHISLLYASYGQHLSLRDSIKARRLIESPWYKNFWPGIRLCTDANTVTKFENTEKGYRLATSVGGALTGEGGDYIVLDDPHNAVEIESDAVREGVIEWWKTSMSTRLNSPKNGRYIVVMQRLHEGDLSGHILGGEDGDWTHLMLPMEYEPKRHCFIAGTGFHDPRGVDEDGELLPGMKQGLLQDPEVIAGSPLAEREGVLLWPERVGEREVGSLKKALGPFAAAGQLQQNPTPKGGGIIKAAWWKKFPPEGEELEYVKVRRAWDEQAQAYVEREVLDFPLMEYVIACADTAYTEKEENDYSACVVLGVWRDKTDAPRVMVMRYWQERLELHKLVARLARTCCLAGKGKNAVHVDKLLIENKASGKSVAQEIRRLFGTERWMTETHDVRGDKVARAYSVQAMFADGMVYAPDRGWAQELIGSTAMFPKGAHDDAQDALFSGLRYLRDGGYLQMKRERVIEVEESKRLRPQAAALYDV